MFPSLMRMYPLGYAYIVKCLKCVVKMTSVLDQIKRGRKAKFPEPDRNKRSLIWKRDRDSRLVLGAPTAVLSNSPYVASGV